MNGGKTFYRADLRGLNPGQYARRQPSWWLENGRYTWATTSLELARAFAMYAFGARRDDERAVYRIELDASTALRDPALHSDERVAFVASRWGVVRGIVDDDNTTIMGCDEAWEIMRNSVRWPDKSAAYADDGYANVPPPWWNDPRFDNDEMRRGLHRLGAYPEPQAVVRVFNDWFRRCAVGTDGLV